MKHIYIVISLVTFACAGCSSPAKESAAPDERKSDSIRLEPSSPHLAFLKLEVVSESDAAAALSLTGRVTFNEDHTQRLASPIDGRVTAVLPRLGDKVQVGQPLIEMMSPQVGQIQADAQKALQDVIVAEKAVERLHRLEPDGAVSVKEMTLAEADFKKAKYDVARTSAQLKALGISATDPAVSVTLRARVAGTLVERNVLVGQEVRADQVTPLLTVSSLEEVWVLADVYEQDLSLIQDGATVGVQVPAYPGETFPGTVTHIGDVIDATSRTVKVRCSVKNPDHKLKPEMFARMELSNRAGKKAISIPLKAVLTEGEESKVIVEENNVYRASKVQVGPESDGKVRIISGLSPGQKIVTEGALFLKQAIDNH